MKYKLLFVCFLISGFSQSEVLQDSIAPKILSVKYGDLDGDSIDERILVIETDIKSDFGFLRLLKVQRKNNQIWLDIIESDNAILRSDEGGMMGDPFQDIEIVRGKLRIHFFGGSSWKWSFTDTYELINDKLILKQWAMSQFKLCEYFEKLEFKLATGECNYSREYEKCERGEQLIYKTEKENFRVNPLLVESKARNTKEFIIVTPLYKREFFFSKN